MSEPRVLDRLASTSLGLGRRAFLRNSLRYTAVGAVAGVTGFAMCREAGAVCGRPSLCGQCPVFTSGCDLPKADRFRDEGGAVGRELEPGRVGKELAP